MSRRFVLITVKTGVIVGVADLEVHDETWNVANFTAPVKPNTYDVTSTAEAQAMTDPNQLLRRPYNPATGFGTQPALPLSLETRRFIALFTPAEFTDSRKVRETNAKMDYFWALVDASQFIKLSHPYVTEALQLMTQLDSPTRPGEKILTVARAQAIAAGT